MLTTKAWVRLGLVVAALVIFGPRSSAQTFSCSSDDGKRHYCPADTRGGVQLSRQRSESPCQQGYTWGFDRGGVWVDRGCRADFTVNSYGYRVQEAVAEERSPVPPTMAGGTIVAKNLVDGRVRLVQQRSESPCREGYSWGSDGRGIWVDHGCRADFAVEGGRGGDWDRDRYRDRDWNRGGGADAVVSCASDDMRRHYCPVDVRGGVQLLKQRSDSTCRQGYSWGYDRRGIWVDHGCRADFQVVR